MIGLGLLSAGNSMYIDPAATSVLLASITSIAVAIGSVFIILWRKFKKGAKKVLHIDENAGKEVEDDLVILDDSIKDGEAEAAATTETEKTEEAPAAAEEKKEEEEAATAEEKKEE